MKAASHVLFCAAPVSLAVSASAQKISPAQGMPHGVGPAIGSALGLVLKSQVIHPQTQRITALRVVYEDFTTIDALPPEQQPLRATDNKTLPLACAESINRMSRASSVSESRTVSGASSLLVRHGGLRQAVLRRPRSWCPPARLRTDNV